jgi:hypothetical protein
MRKRIGALDEGVAASRICGMPDRVEKNNKKTIKRVNFSGIIMFAVPVGI